ncbi:MAG: hypothetical protein AB2421_17435 [Thermotaleaceae bacterium]
MFLHMLNRKEKEGFLDLAFSVSAYDGEFTVEEKGMIEQYRKETGLDSSEHRINEKAEIENILKVFDDSEKTVKNAIFIEILGLVLCDQNFAEKEKVIIGKVMEKLQIPEKQLEPTMQWINDLNKVYQRANELINM